MSNERIDDLHRNGYRLIQDPQKFCFGVDAVLLSDFAIAEKNEKVLDLCSGNGVIPILLSAKTKASHFTGLEIQQDSVSLAKRSVVLNCLTDKIDMVCGDLKNATEIFGLSVFDVITCNPPYMPYGGGLLNEKLPLAYARHEILCNLKDVIYCASSLLKPLGRLYMIHRPQRLVDIFSLMREYHLEPKTLRMVHPYSGSGPSMALVSAVRGGKPFLKVEPPLVIYKEKGIYTDEITKIYYK